jgi:hypothetical protein
VARRLGGTAAPTPPASDLSADPSNPKTDGTNRKHNPARRPAADRFEALVDALGNLRNERIRASRASFMASFAGQNSCSPVIGVELVARSVV